MWAAERVGKDTPAGGRARATGGGRVRVGGVGSDWWDGSYWGGKEQNVTLVGQAQMTV